MTQEQMVERARTVSRLGWQAKDLASKFSLSHISDDQLGERYKELCDLIPPCPDNMLPRTAGNICQCRIDDGYINWQKQYEPEIEAISQEFRRRRRRIPA